MAGDLFWYDHILQDERQAWLGEYPYHVVRGVTSSEWL